MSAIINKISRLFKATKNYYKNPYCTAVIPAAGSSSRMGGEDKLFAELDGIPVIARTLLQMQGSEYINEIIVVTQESSIVPIADICAEYDISKVKKVVCGGEERMDSVLIGALEASPETEFIAVHDGARPLVTKEVIADVCETAFKHNASVPAIPVSDTIKTAKNKVVTGTLDRNELYAVQTPQVIRAEMLTAALQGAKKNKTIVTDDSSAVEKLGISVVLSKGSYENIKITTPIDLAFAEAIIRERNKK